MQTKKASLLTTYVVSYGTGIGVGNPGHLPLPCAHIGSRHINTRSCWQQQKWVLGIKHKQLSSTIIPLGTVQALAENCFPVWSSVSYASNRFFWVRFIFRCHITRSYDTVKTSTLSHQPSTNMKVSLQIKSQSKIMHQKHFGLVFFFWSVAAVTTGRALSSYDFYYNEMLTGFFVFLH